MNAKTAPKEQGERSIRESYSTLLHRLSPCRCERLKFPHRYEISCKNFIEMQDRVTPYSNIDEATGIRKSGEI